MLYYYPVVTQFGFRRLDRSNDATIKRMTFIVMAVAQRFQGDQMIRKRPGAQSKIKTRLPGSSTSIDPIHNVGNCRNMASTVPIIPAACITPKIHQ